MDEDPTATKLSTAAQLAKRLQVSTEWVYRLARDQEIPAFRVEQACRFDWGEILETGRRGERKRVVGKVSDGVRSTDLLLVEELASVLQVDEEAVYRLLQREAIPQWRSGVAVRLHLAEVLDWLRVGAEPREYEWYCPPPFDHRPLPADYEHLLTEVQVTEWLRIPLDHIMGSHEELNRGWLPHFCDEQEVRFDRLEVWGTFHRPNLVSYEPVD